MKHTIDIKDHVNLARERILVYLKERGIDALIATSPANVQYISGYRSWTHPLHITNQTNLLLTADGKRSLILPSSDGDFVSMGRLETDEIQTYGTFFIEDPGPKSELSVEEEHMATFASNMTNKLDWINALKETLVSEGLTKARLAIDQGHIMSSHWIAIQEALPDAELVDAFQLMIKIRMVKTPYEQEMLRLSSECTETAIKTSMLAATNGADDREIRRVFEQSVIASGAEHFFSAIGVGTRTCFPNVVPNGSRMRQGEILRYDAGCRYQGYPSDIARIATLGPAPEKVKKYYQAMLDGEEAAIQFMRPGVIAEDVFEVAMKATKKGGVPHYQRHHCGHAIGLDSYELPIIRPGDKTPLEAGMTFCVETPYYELGLGGIQVEDMVLITDDGAELITSMDRGLFELPM